VAEEHVRRGGFGAELALHMADRGQTVRRFLHAHARAHHFERYGSQAWLRRQSGLDAESVLTLLAGA
jgi:transketolase